MSTHPIDIITNAVRNPDSVAPRNGYKESDADWTARVVRYALTDERTIANARRALLEEGYSDTDQATLHELAEVVLRSVGGA